MTNLVLVHGLPDGPGTWSKVQAILKSHDRVSHAIQLPGFSEDDSLNEDSSFDDIATKLAQRLPPGPCIFVGHDFGGLLGALLAARPETTIQSLILINAPTPDLLRTTIDSDEDQSKRSAYARKIIDNPRAVLSAKNFAFLKAFLFKPEHDLASEYTKFLLNMWARPENQDAIGAYYRGFFASTFAPTKFSQPCLQIWTSGDPFLGDAVRASMRERFHNHRILNIDSESHWPQLLQPSAIAHHILQETNGL